MALITYETPVIPWHVAIGVEENSCDLCTYSGYLREYANSACQKKIPRYHTIFLLAAGSKLALLVKV